MIVAGGGGMLDEGGATIVQVGTALLSTMVAQQIADAIPGQVEIEKRSNLRGDVAHQKVFNAREAAKAIRVTASTNMLKETMSGIANENVAFRTDS